MIHNINKYILKQYIIDTSTEMGKDIIIEDVDVLNIKDDGLETTFLRKSEWGQKTYETVPRPSLFVNVHFNNKNGKKNKIFMNLSYHHFIEYSNRIRRDKLNKIKEKIQ
jgi:hypothetical protein